MDHAHAHHRSRAAHAGAAMPHVGEAKREKAAARASPWRLGLSATLHCLTGCAIGEVAGMAIGTGLGWGNAATIALSVVLAFAFGYLLTLWPLRRAGMPVAQAARLALAADTASIATMEVVDNAIMLAIPGAMDASLADPLFWGALGVSLALAGLAAWPVNRWLIARGAGHAAVHARHAHPPDS